MTTIALPINSPPPEAEIEAAVRSLHDLTAFLSMQLDTQRVDFFDRENNAHAINLPTSALRLLLDILGELALGNAVKIVPIHDELSTQEAADLLNVSRPHLVKLLEAGELPFHKTGRHRRVLFSDLMAFKQRRDTVSQEAMDALAQQAQELRMGYE